MSTSVEGSQRADMRPLSLGLLRITEPATMATDFVIAAMCTAFGMVLGGGAAGTGSARGLWALSFGFTAAAALIGGVVHGFALHLERATKQRLWKATQYAMGLTGLAILAAAVVAFVGGPARLWLLAGAVAKLVAYAAVVQRRDDYTVVMVDYGLSMIALAALASVGWARDGAAASPWLVAGVVVSAVAAAVQAAKVAPHRHFNHNDLYHVIQMAALYLFFRGGALLDP
jgi:hypothetical protein